MPIVRTGKKSFEVNLSEKTKSILQDEQEQLKQNGNIIYEKECIPDWVFRLCPNCFYTYMMKIGEIFKCIKCGIIKVPKGINYTSGGEI